MPKFSQRSLDALKNVHPDLKLLCYSVIQIYDFTILEGHRPMHDQNKYFSEGKSKLRWPESKHNQFPSKAIDVSPYPIDWSDEPKAKARFYQLSGIFLAMAHMFKIKIRLGLDWNSNMRFDDQTFDDLPHVELK